MEKAVKASDDLTFGQQLVGLTFNPSGDPRVNRAKEICAELADMVQEDYKEQTPPSYLYNLVKGGALKEILNAQMNVVKLLTLKR
jgi:hypothetical protein